MTAPEPSTGTQDLAEKVARARQNIAHEGSRAFPVPRWEGLNPHEQRIATLDAANWLNAIRAAGLAVVELPKPEPWPDGPAGSVAMFGPVEAHVDDDGSTEIRSYVAHVRDIDRTERAGAAMIAAARWARIKGGEPR